MKPHKHAELIKAWADEYLMYDKEAGKVFWKKQPRGRAKLGDEAGRVVKGYRRIGVMNEEIQTHILIWILHYGEYPQGLIDHIDYDSFNNRIENLRIATPLENQHNQVRPHKTSTTGLLGVGTSRGKFIARISVNNQSVFLGRFDTKEEAHSKYIEAKQKYHPTAFTGV